MLNVVLAEGLCIKKEVGGDQRCPKREHELVIPPTELHNLPTPRDLCLCAPPCVGKPPRPPRRPPRASWPSPEGLRHLICRQARIRQVCG